MPRQPRVWYPGAMYHIVARGNRRAAIFHDHVDFQTYLAILEDIRSMMPFILHSYCLMTNHLHLQLETIHHYIQYIMKEMHSRYAVYLNQRLRTDSHVFQGRYGARLIETNAYFLEVSRYIHRNPLEAKMVVNLSKSLWLLQQAVRQTRLDQQDSLRRFLLLFSFCSLFHCLRR